MSPTGNMFWDFILTVVGLATAIAVLYGAAKGLPRVATDTEKAKVSPLPPTSEGMWTEMRKLRAELDEVREEQAAMTKRLGVVEMDRDALGDGLRAIADWDDAGRPDPPGFPGIAAHARRVLDRLHHSA